jgi:hypothetical protein
VPPRFSPLHAGLHPHSSILEESHVCHVDRTEPESPRNPHAETGRASGKAGRPYSFSRCVWYCWKKDCSTRSNSDSTGVGVRPPTSQSHTQPPKRQVCHYAARGHPRFMTSTTTYPMMSISHQLERVLVPNPKLYRKLHFIMYRTVRYIDLYPVSHMDTSRREGFDQRECGTW